MNSNFEKSSKKPKVTIVIPTYNQEKYIAQAIESALKQDYPHIEVVLSDDCSTDSTPKIAKEYIKDKRFRYFRNKKNLGRVANYRKSLYEYAKGDYYLNLDGDDFLIDDSYISKAVEIFLKDKCIVMVMARSGMILENSKEILIDKQLDKNFYFYTGNTLFINYPKIHTISNLTCLFDRRLAIKKNYYSKDLLFADLESNLRLILNKNIAFYNQTVGFWRKHSFNASRGISLKEFNENIELINSLYHSANKLRVFKDRDLKKWKLRMYYYFVVKILIRMCLVDREVFKEALILMRGQDKRVFNRIIFNPKFSLLLLITKNNFLSKLVFDLILNEHSFYLELKELRSLKNKND